MTAKFKLRARFYRECARFAFFLAARAASTATACTSSSRRSTHTMEKQRLLNLTPYSYIGKAAELENGSNLSLHPGLVPEPASYPTKTSPAMRRDLFAMNRLNACTPAPRRYVHRLRLLYSAKSLFRRPARWRWRRTASPILGQ